MSEIDYSAKFHPYTTEKSPNYGRTLKEYEEMLGFNRKDLANKTILDLGSSEKDYFYHDLKEGG
jgi:hypothetical protein